MNAQLRASLEKSLPRWLFDALRFARHPRTYLTMVPGPLTYNQDGLATRHKADFLDDPRFRRAYASGKATGSWKTFDIPWRAYVNCWAADHAAHLGGDFVECGVYKGGYARAIVDYLGPNRLPAHYYLVDTYQGFEDPKLFSAEERAVYEAYATAYEPSYEAVKRTFAPFPNVHVVQGSVPGVLEKVPAERVAFLALDMNCAAPEVAAAKYFWDKLVVGGVMVLDDYALYGHPAQKRAMDGFVAAKGHAVLTLPTGQGFLIKH